MSETRRDALRILGSITATCAFPFAGDELYGQHVHPMIGQAGVSGPYKPGFFVPAEYAVVSRMADVIIPRTDTPGATDAGVPEYIDRVMVLNTDHHPLVRAGLRWLQEQARSRYSREYLLLDEPQHVAILQPLSEAVDLEAREQQRGRYRTGAPAGRVYYVAVTDRTPLPRPALSVTRDPNDPRMPASFFRLMKNLIADGYYTSRIGLLEELGYAGNAVLSRFAACGVPEH